MEQDRGADSGAGGEVMRGRSFNDRWALTRIKKEKARKRWNLNTEETETEGRTRRGNSFGGIFLLNDYIAEDRAWEILARMAAPADGSVRPRTSITKTKERAP